LAAAKIPSVGNLSERLLAIAHNGFFAAAVTLYGALAVFWVWILSFTPLSRAYIFAALAITPIAEALVFGEQFPFVSLSESASSSLGWCAPPDKRCGTNITTQLGG